MIPPRMVLGFGEAWAMKILEDGSVDGRLLTAEEVAALLRVTRSWVYADTRRDGLPHLRLGRYVRYRRSGRRERKRVRLHCARALIAASAAVRQLER
jgi:excisionase family DNA binding protein